MTVPPFQVGAKGGRPSDLGQTTGEDSNAWHLPLVLIGLWDGNLVGSLLGTSPLPPLAEYWRVFRSRFQMEQFPRRKPLSLISLI